MTLQQPARLDPLTPPDAFAMPVIICPACMHGIDPHGADPGGKCGVGDEQRHLCPCLWSPNDIAAHWMSARRGPYLEPGLGDPNMDAIEALQSGTYRGLRVVPLRGWDDPGADIRQDIATAITTMREAAEDYPSPSEPCS